MKTKNKFKKVVLVLALVFVLTGALFAFSGCDFIWDLFPEYPPIIEQPGGNQPGNNQPGNNQPGDNNNQPDPTPPVDPSVFDGGLRVYFIDVGQGDAALIRIPQGDGDGYYNILVDAGRHNITHNRFRQDIRSFFPTSFDGTRQMVFDWFIVTHAHADHIGSGAYVVQHSYIANIVRPVTFDPREEIPLGIYRDFGINSADVANGYLGPIGLPNTDTFRDFGRAMRYNASWINDGDTNIVLPYVGKTIELGDAVITFYSPTQYHYQQHSNAVNPYSTIFCLYFNGRRIVFTGDAYVENENRVIISGYLPFPTNVDVLDVGHHGSNTSTGQAWLAHLNPTYAIIQVGRPGLAADGGTGNGHGHPHTVVTNRLTNAGINTFRTDQEGSVLVRVSPCGDYLEVVAIGALR